MTVHADPELLWYIPNTVTPGHRGDDTVDGWGSLEYTVGLARSAEEHGWGGALIGTGWGRPDTFTVATAIAAGTTRFTPLVAVRPGYWHPAHFASAAATLDRLSGGRLFINIVSGTDDLAAYGDGEFDSSRRYDRTREFLQIVRKLWHDEDVSYRGEFFHVEHSTVQPRPFDAQNGRHPRLYFGGASAAAEAVAAAEADVQLFWGEPLDGIAERIDRLTTLSESLGRQHAPLQFGLRVTTLIRRRPATPARPRRAGRGSRLLPLHHTGPIRRRWRRHDLAGRFGIRRRRRVGAVCRAGHHPFRAVRHPLSVRSGKDRRPAAASASRSGSGPALSYR